MADESSESSDGAAGPTDRTGSRTYIFRGDESYRGGTIGRDLGPEADEADIQDFATHVLRKDSSRSSRFTSFTTELKIARSIFTSANDNRFVVKLELSSLRELESKGRLNIWEPDLVFERLSQSPGKMAKRAADVRTAMRRNREVLIEGQVPGELVKSVQA